MSEASNAKPITAPYFDEGLDKANRLLSALEPQSADLLVIGDSIAEGWPVELFACTKMIKLGIGGDRIENVRWRLREKDHAVIETKSILIVAGTNNLWSGDTGTVSFDTLVELVEDCKRIWPRASVLVQAVAPFAAQLGHLNPQRDIFNGLTARSYACVFPDAAFVGRSDCFQADQVHFTVAGYVALTEALERAMVGNRLPSAR